jgi:hypothetical protein
MEGGVLTGGVLVAGLTIFFVGAAAWRLEYDRPLQESLPAVHRDSHRWTWIHVWMVAGLTVTTAGLAALSMALPEAPARVLAAMGLAVYLLGAICWLASILFRLTVVPWAAERLVSEGHLPDGFVAYDRWATALYIVHMLSAYAAASVLGVAALASDAFPDWLGWSGVAWGLTFGAGMVLTKFAGPFNPPLWAHVYTATLGVALLVG